jgi:septum formation protein
LQLPFQTASPNIDETPAVGENAPQTALRLSKLKAEAVAQQHPNALIIGSDQVALLGDQQLGKPLTHDNAVQQLRAMRGKTVNFFTAVSLLNAHTNDMQTALVETKVSFRDITNEEIERYLRKEQPYHCAGSAKSEGLGIALIKQIEGDDPNALIGLPLIILVDMFKKQGVEII